MQQYSNSLVSIGTRQALVTSLQKCGLACQAIARGNLNYGGCGVYALGLVTALRSIGIRAVPWCFGYNNISRNWVYANWRQHENRHGMRHVIVRVGRTLWADSDVISTGPRKGWSHYGYGYGPLHPVPAPILRWYVENGAWNSSFDRSSIPAIRDTIASHFNPTALRIAA